jgi:hypothetical protein
MAIPDGWEEVELPDNYDDEVVAAAIKHGVDPDLAMAVHHQEYNPRQWVSSAGARGPMQLMPGTAKDLGVNPDDPVDNIDGGVRYLKQMLEQKKSVPLALAAYNAGPARVDTGVPMSAYGYVKKVMERADHFRANPKYEFLDHDPTPKDDSNVELPSDLQPRKRVGIPEQNPQYEPPPQDPEPDTTWTYNPNTRQFTENTLGQQQAQAIDPNATIGEMTARPSPEAITTEGVNYDLPPPQTGGFPLKSIFANRGSVNKYFYDPQKNVLDPSWMKPKSALDMDLLNPVSEVPPEDRLFPNLRVRGDLVYKTPTFTLGPVTIPYGGPQLSVPEDAVGFDENLKVGAAKGLSDTISKIVAWGSYGTPETGGNENPLDRAELDRKLEEFFGVDQTTPPEVLLDMIAREAGASPESVLASIAYVKGAWGVLAWPFEKVLAAYPTYRNFFHPLVSNALGFGLQGAANNPDNPVRAGLAGAGAGLVLGGTNAYNPAARAGIGFSTGLAQSYAEEPRDVDVLQRISSAVQLAAFHGVGGGEGLKLSELRTENMLDQFHNSARAEAERLVLEEHPELKDDLEALASHVQAVMDFVYRESLKPPGVEGETIPTTPPGEANVSQPVEEPPSAPLPPLKRPGGELKTTEEPPATELVAPTEVVEDKNGIPLEPMNAVDEAAHQAADSPVNGLKESTKPQQEAGVSGEKPGGETAPREVKEGGSAKADVEANVKTIAENIRKFIPGGVEVVQSASELPSAHVGAAKREMESRGGEGNPLDAVQGYFHDGKIYLVADNLANVKDVEATMRHEAGHAIAAAFHDSPSAQQFFKNVFLAKGKEMYGKPTTPEAQGKAAEEWFVEQVATGDWQKRGGVGGWFDKYADKFRQWMREKGFTVKASNSEIADMVAQYRDRISGLANIQEGLYNAKNSPVFSLKDKSHEKLAQPEAKSKRDSSKAIDLDEAKRTVLANIRSKYRDSGTSHEGQSGPYERRSPGDDSGVRLLVDGKEVKILHQYQIASKEDTDGLNNVGVSTPNIFEIHSDEASTFHGIMRQFAKENKFSSSVSIYNPKDYAKMRLFLLDKGKGGFALKPRSDLPDGTFDVVSVFSRDGGTGAAHTMLLLANQEGGRTLDCYDTMLPYLYGMSGYRAVGRTPFSDEWKPGTWDYEVYKRFNNGKPNVIAMIYDPEYGKPYVKTDGKQYGPDDYDKMISDQRKFVTELKSLQ